MVGGGNSGVEEGLFLDQVCQQDNGVGVSGPAKGQPDTVGEGREAPKYGDNAWQGSLEIQRKRPLGVDNRLGSENR